MKRMKLIGALTAVVVSLFVILQNTQSVDIRFLFIKVTMPNAILLGITLLIGIAIGMLIALSMSGKHARSQS